MNTKLITAEEWNITAGKLAEEIAKLQLIPMFPKQVEQIKLRQIRFFQMIQLNAAKWGMEQAAEIQNKFQLTHGGNTWFMVGTQVYKEAILATADKLEFPKD